MVQGAAAGVRHAFTALDAQGPVVPSWSAVAFVGHSLGGLIAARCAADGPARGLPAPRALMCVQAGWGRRFRTSLGDLAGVAPDTLALVMAGEDDRHLPPAQPRAIYNALAAVPFGNRNFVLLRSDRHGTPPLVADHGAPLSERPDIGPRLPPAVAWLRTRAMAHLGLRSGAADALDFYGHWKLLDALFEAALGGEDRDVALGDTPRQRDMGRWSDGTPVRELLVTVGPADEGADGGGHGGR
jgi:pimeloyl-ACP methyl ester carboxylesterase